jgi:hypothetical protein
MTAPATSAQATEAATPALAIRFFFKIFPFLIADLGSRYESHYRLIPVSVFFINSHDD